MARTEKQFDAVQMMRSIRDRISEEIKGMTFDEEQAYIREGLRDASIREVRPATADEGATLKHAAMLAASRDEGTAAGSDRRPG